MRENYSLIVFLNILMSYLGYKFKDNFRKKIIYFMSFIICLYIIISLGKTAPDYLSYKLGYLTQEFGVTNLNFEFGFRLLNKFLYSIFNSNYNMVYCCYIGIILFFQIKSIKFYCKDSISFQIVILFIMLLEVKGMGNLIRQYIAISIVFFASTYLVEKKILKSSIITALACSFHISAIVFFVIIIGSIVKFDFKKVCALLLLALLFISVVIIFWDKIIYKINLYSDGGIKESFGVLSFAILFMYIISLYLHIRFKNNDKYIFLGLIYYLLFFIFLKHGFLSRNALFFRPFVFISIANTIKYINNIYLKNIVFISMFFIGFIGTINIYI